MIITTTNTGILEDNKLYENTKYFGNSVMTSNLPTSIKDNFRNNQGRNCTTNGVEGIIIGFEDSNSYKDYYWIIYCPFDGKLRYELYNDPNFYKTIK